MICYNSADRDAAVVLAEGLKYAGLTPWIDTEQVPPGRSFQELLQGALGSVGAVLVLIGVAGLTPVDIRLNSCRRTLTGFLALLAVAT